MRVCCVIRCGCYVERNLWGGDGARAISVAPVVLGHSGVTKVGLQFMRVRVVRAGGKFKIVAYKILLWQTRNC